MHIFLSLIMLAAVHACSLAPSLSAVMLAAASSPFRAMFVSSPMREASLGRVRLRGVSRAALALVLRHLYTGELAQLQPGDVAEVLDFSVLYDFAKVMINPQ